MKVCTCGHLLLISYRLQLVEEDVVKLSERAHNGLCKEVNCVASLTRQMLDAFTVIKKIRESVQLNMKPWVGTGPCTCEYSALISEPLQVIEAGVDSLFKAVQAGNHDPRSAVGDATLRMQGQLREVTELREDIQQESQQ